jgi:hypothetical protein
VSLPVRPCHQHSCLTSQRLVRLDGWGSGATGTAAAAAVGSSQKAHVARFTCLQEPISTYRRQHATGRGLWGGGTHGPVSNPWTMLAQSKGRLLGPHVVCHEPAHCSRPFLCASMSQGSSARAIRVPHTYQVVAEYTAKGPLPPLWR